MKSMKKTLRMIQTPFNASKTRKVKFKSSSNESKKSLSSSKKSKSPTSKLRSSVRKIHKNMINIDNLVESVNELKGKSEQTFSKKHKRKSSNSPLVLTVKNLDTGKTSNATVVKNLDNGKYEFYKLSSSK